MDGGVRGGAPAQRAGHHNVDIARARDVHGLCNLVFQVVKIGDTGGGDVRDIMGHGDEGLAVKAMKLGAFDYVVKTGDFFEVIPQVIRKAITERELKTKVRQVEEEKKRLQAQLQQAQKMEAIGTLAGGIAHDFNNILTTVLGYSDLILIDENLSPEVAKKVRVIETAARKASSLVSKLLSFARRGSIEPVPFDINQVVNETVEMLSRIISNDITIKRSFNVRIPPVMGDVNQVEQILMNLIINAKDAISGNGEITISTSTVELSSEGFSLPADIRKGQYVKLSVSDTGKGIPEEHRERIFEPFFTTQGVGKGTGLGLAMVYGIVKEHGGYITVDSEIGVGTTFDIYLPVAEARTPGSRSDLIDNGKSVGEILVVDDEFTVLDLIKETLLRNGFSVKAFDNPLQGLNYFRTNSKKVSLVIADIVMPEMDGIQLIESIRELNPNIKIIATTGFSQNLGDIEVEGFLKKPFQSSKLMSIVREVLNGEDDAVNLK